MPLVRIRYYALIKDITGVSDEELPFDSCLVSAQSIIESVKTRHPELSDFVARSYVLVVHSGKLVKDLGTSLDVCSEPVVDLIPPSAGGGESYESRIVFNCPIDAGAFMKNLMSRLDPEVGAVSVYFGIVKGVVSGSNVKELKYELHEELSERILDSIAQEAARVDGVKYVVVHHSIGSFKPGDVVLAVGVLSRSRREALEVIREVVERIKHESAIWKIERRDDGIFWVIGNGNRIPRKARDE